MARQLILESAGLGKVGEQYQLTRFPGKRARSDRQAATIA
jgi:hypothetical protein